ncbi:MAG: hypothetical protein HUJ16_00260 [Kangiella sp.]|nr:hypothetical protein [Kangiella sp.]
MGFLLRRLMAYGRWVSLAAAAAEAAAVYGILTTREEIVLFGGAPHVSEWWEPYVWPAATFIVVGRILRMVIRRFTASATPHVARIRRGDIFGPRP